jgi:hypothetical protein
MKTGLISFSEYILGGTHSPSLKLSKKVNSATLEDHSEYLRKNGLHLHVGPIDKLWAQGKSQHYGGWMHPDENIVIYVENIAQHNRLETVLKDVLTSPRYAKSNGSNYYFSTGDGWIRFVYHNKVIGGNNFMGLKGQLQKLPRSLWKIVINESEEIAPIGVDSVDGFTYTSIVYHPNADPRSVSMKMVFSTIQEFIREARQKLQLNIAG